MFFNCTSKNTLKSMFHFFLSSEYWEKEFVTYQCNDTSLGLDQGDSVSIGYRCISDNPGRYAVPRPEKNETWPVCLKRTTTVKPRELL